MIELAFALSLAIYDGDGVSVNGQSYRIVGLDTPEIQGECPAERRLALLARDRLRQLAANYRAILHPIPCVGNNYGRLCARLEIDGIDVSKILIKEGLANPYTCTTTCPRRQSWCNFTTTLEPQ